MSQIKLEDKISTVKKTAKAKVKKVAKKTAKKVVKKVAKVASSKILKDAPKEKYFVLSDGGTVKNPKELADLLEHIRDEIFNHHVRPGSNDFAQWIHDVFEDVELAQKLADAQGRDHARIVLYKHLVEAMPKK